MGNLGLPRLIQKAYNRALYLSSSGSPLRYGRKILTYSAHLGSLLQRRRFAKYFSGTQADPSFFAPELGRLREDGFTLFTPRIDPALQARLQAAVANKTAGDVRGAVTGRGYFGELLREEDLDPAGIFARFSLQEPLLQAVTLYFGQIPQLFNLSLLVSRPTGQEKWIESQLWHRDYDDSRILKLFVYFNDVADAGSGPFTFLKAGDSRRVRRPFIPRRVSDEEMLTAQGGVDRSVSVLGKTGTAFLIDTARCFHMGSRCRTQDRVAFIATYTTMAPLDPRLGRFRVEGPLPPLDALLLRT